jgi:hypothetical protein
MNDTTLGLIVMYAADMYNGAPDDITPPVDARLAQDWDVVGYLTATDAILRGGLTMDQGKEVCYGVLARSRTNCRRVVT